jgi:DNA topoisomerase III
MTQKKTEKTTPKAGAADKEFVLTEKPSVARDIVAALGGKKEFQTEEGYFEGDRYIVSWAVGHLLEFLAPDEIDPIYKRWRLTDLPILPEPFIQKPKSGQKTRLNQLKRLLLRKDVSSVINGCDAGREGELIFREICRYAGKEKPVKRLWLQSMTAEAIRDGFSTLQPGASFEGLGSAAECRAESDWLIGINATRALTKRLQTKKESAAWSVGRVQTPTLALLVERELEILSHQSKSYWRVKAVFRAPDHTYEAWWFDPRKRPKEDEEETRDDWILEEGRAREILERIQDQAGTAKETRKPSREKAPSPFDLTTLQREAHRRFGYSARRTLDSAQRLYERHKLITYPRTDSHCLPNDYEPKVQEALESLSGTEEYADPAGRLLEKGLLNRKRVFNDSGVTDHFAIMPTGLLSKKLPQEDHRVYDLIVRRFLAAFFPEAVWENLERITRVEKESFRTRKRILREPGWRAAYEQKTEGEEALPEIGDKGVDVRTEKAEIVQEEAKPKPRITEAGLLRLMENAGKQIEDDELAELMRDKGLGTPATRAEIIENLISKDYVRRVGKALAATPKAIRLIDILKRIHVDRLSSAELTGELEQHLRQVERGERTREDFNNEIRGYTREIVGKAKEFQFETLYADEPPLGPCPLCKERFVREEGFFYPCEGVSAKQCDFRIWKDKQGRYLDRHTVETLIREGKTPPVAGFFTRDGKGYSARLALDAQGQVQILPAQEQESTGPLLDENTTPLGPCPKCEEGNILTAPDAYICSKSKEIGCSFKLPARLCQRTLSGEEVIAFLNQGRTAVLDGFISKRGRPFRASLVLGEKGKIEWEFPPRGKNGSQEETREAGEIRNPEPVGPCPVCKKGNILEAENAYVCRNGNSSCSYNLPRTILGREMTREEITDYIRDGRTEILDGFISRRGRPFRATLYMKKNGKHGFKFPPRED